MSKSPCNKLIFFWLALLMCALGALGWMIWSIYSNNAKVADLGNQIEQLLEQNDSLNRFRKVAKDSAKEQDKINSYLINKDNEVKFIEEIENLGKSQQIDVSIDTVTEKTIPPDTRKVLSINASVKGSWQHVFRFLNLLEVMPHKIAITNIDLKQMKSDNASTTSKTPWEGTMTINAAMTK